MEGWTIHVDDPDDRLVRGTVALHQEQIAGGFMTSLGPRFLAEVFNNIVRSPHGVSLVATDHATGPVTGFLLGATHTGLLYRDFLRHRALKALAFAAPRLLRPASLRKLFETLRYPSRQPPADLPEAELLDLAVDDARKGTGLAQELFDVFVREMQRRGCARFRVTTGAALTRAHRFYERRGAVRVAEMEIHRGETTYIFVYDAERAGPQRMGGAAPQ